MTKIYIKEMLSEFDQEFESLVIPFPGEVTTTEFPEAADKLQKIEDLAAKISAERYSTNYNPEIALANLLNTILSDDLGQTAEDNFFQLLNEERQIDLSEALTDFDFYQDNPYKKKAEKLLSKIEARKNK